jgi:TrmH family RNA methyltransferase
VLGFRSEPVQHLRRLTTNRRFRWTERRFVIEGPNRLEEALRSGLPVEGVYIETTASADLLALADRAKAGGAAVFELQTGVLARVCEVATPQPVAAVVPMVDVGVGDIDFTSLAVVAVGVQDPGNAGTIVRSAGASGAGAVIFCEGSVDLYNPKTVRSSAGALFHIPAVTGVNAEEVLDELGRKGLRRLATVPRQGDIYSDVDLTGATALVMGAEAAGLPDAALARCDGRITVPMAADSESLNVAMAATVLCYEAARQRGWAFPNSRIRPGST